MGAVLRQLVGEARLEEEEEGRRSHHYEKRARDASEAELLDGGPRGIGGRIWRRTHRVISPLHVATFAAAPLLLHALTLSMDLHVSLLLSDTE